MTTSTLRRRFFPSTPVQTVPGNTVALEVQLRPGAAPAPAPGPVAAPVQAMCTGWLAPWLAVVPPDFLAVEVLPDGRTAMHGGYSDEVDYSSWLASLWEGTPPLLDELTRARPIPDASFICTELEIETSYYKPFPGRHFMAQVPVTGGTWEIAWDAPNPDEPGDPTLSANGHRAIVTSGTLVLALLDTGGDFDAVDTLTARAYASPGGPLVKELTFRARRVAF